MPIENYGAIRILQWHNRTIVFISSYLLLINEILFLTFSPLKSLTPHKKNSLYPRYRE